MPDPLHDPPPVLVVGAGPAGLVAALTLARYDVPVLLVERRARVSTLSRALVISTRSMEILRAWGLEDDVRSGAADVEPLGWVTDTLASGEGRVIPLGYPTAAEAALVSPTRPAWAPQDHVEPLLLGLLADAAAAEVRFGCELVDLAQHDGRVVATLREAASGQVRELETDYVIGADGAHSTVRALLGIGMDGADDLAEYHTVQFQAPLAPVTQDRRYGLNVITHPDAAGVITSRGRGDRWGYAREWRPGQDRLVDASHERLRQLIRTAAGVPSLEPHIERVSGFSFAAQLADRYREGGGFLVGDAAHRMTPRGGTGMNTAIQDAYDLGWKLAWVVRDWAGPGLLDSYEAERRPIGLYNVTRSGDPNGAQRQAGETLQYDLNGRLAHHWLDHGAETVSTLDLLGAGLTLITGPDGQRWEDAGRSLRTAVLLTSHTVDEPSAHALGIPPSGAILARPDGKPLLRWPRFDGSLGQGPLPLDIY